MDISPYSKGIMVATFTIIGLIFGAMSTYIYFGHRIIDDFYIINDLKDELNNLNEENKDLQKQIDSLIKDLDEETVTTTIYQTKTIAVTCTVMPCKSRPFSETSWLYIWAFSTTTATIFFAILTYRKKPVSA